MCMRKTYHNPSIRQRHTEHFNPYSEEKIHSKPRNVQRAFKESNSITQNAILLLCSSTDIFTCTTYISRELHCQPELGSRPSQVQDWLLAASSRDRDVFGVREANVRLAVVTWLQRMGWPSTGVGHGKIDLEMCAHTVFAVDSEAVEIVDVQWSRSRGRLVGWSGCSERSWEESFSSDTFLHLDRPFSSPSVKISIIDVL